MPVPQLSQMFTVVAYVPLPHGKHALADSEPNGLDLPAPQLLHVAPSKYLPAAQDARQVLLVVAVAGTKAEREKRRGRRRIDVDLIFA